MDCSEYAHEVQALVDDGLPPVERLLMEDHEWRCYACVERRAETVRLFAALDAMEKEAAPASFEGAVLQCVLGGPAHATPTRPNASLARSPLISLLLLASIAAALLGSLNGSALELARAGLGRFAGGWYGWAQEVPAGLMWLQDASWAELVTLGRELQDAVRQVLGALGGSQVLFALGMLLVTATVLRPRRGGWPAARPQIRLGLLAALAAGLVVSTPTQDAFAADVKSERPRDEIVRLEDSVETRRLSLDSLLLHIENLSEAQIDKSILEQVHALTEALREDRRRLRQLRDAVVPMDVEPAPRPPRPPRPSRPHGDKVIARNLVKLGEDVEVRTGETVTGDVIIVDGDLWVDGHVDGDAIVLGGNLHLGRRASVTGQAIAVAGRVNRTPGADVGGQMMSLTLMPSAFLPGARPHWVSLVLDLFKLGLLLLIAGLFLAVVPQRMARARAQLGESFLKCFGVGLVVLFGGMFAVGVTLGILVITLIGIPAAFLVTIGTGVLLIASLFVGVLLVGDRLQELLRIKRRAPWVSVGLGLVFVMLPELLSDVFRVAFPSGPGFGISLFSWGLVLVTVAAGLGAIVVSRLGASESGQSPQPST
jgi:hypothetical protein